MHASLSSDRRSFHAIYRPVHRFFSACWLMLLISLTTLGAWAQNPMYVTPNGAGTRNGSSWTNAISGTALQGALASAPSGTTVLVASGLYKPTTSADRTISFSIASGVEVYGGYTAGTNTRTTNPSSTTFSGDIDNDNTFTGNTYKVVQTSGSNVVLDGLGITQGDARPLGPFITAGGGGLFADNASISLRQVQFINNAAKDGGGVFINKGSASLTNCFFSQNIVTGGGGAALYFNNRVTGDLASCSFSGNTADSQAGAMYNNNSSPTITNCSFNGNSASNLGGAMYNNNSSPTITNCSFSRNTSTQGGAMYNDTSSPTITNCSFSGNTASSGGVMSNLGFTFSDLNVSASPTLTNCILWGNQAPAVSNGDAASTTYGYTDSQDGVQTGTGNLSVDPRFADAANNNLQLTACSPLINVGDNSVSAGSTDLAGNPRRFNSSVIDLGAYEFQGNIGQPIGITLQPASSSAVCAGAAVTATVSVSGTSPTYQWYKDGTSLGAAQQNATLSLTNVQTSQTGSYSVVVTGSCNSVTSTAFSLTVNSSPTATLLPSSSTLTCTSTSVTLTAGGGNSYTLTGGAGTQTNTSGQFTVSQAGSYIVTVASAGGCTSTTSAVVSGDQTTPSVNINPSSATLTCASPSVSLTAVGTGTVRWSTTQTTPIISVSASSTYSVTLTSPNGCTASTSVVISQDNTVPSISITPSSATLTCASPSVSLTAVGTGSVLWSTGETTPTITVYAANIYSVTLTSANGCTATAQTTVFSSTSLVAPILTASALSTTNQPISVTATGCTGGTINWTVLGGSGSADGPIYTLSQPGSYTLSATCSIGECTSSPSQALSLQIQAGGPFRLVAPTYDCATGAITFNTLGGDGSLIQYFAIGITPWTTQANQTVEAGLRGDPKVLELHARQSGIEVTYSFDLPAFCSGLQPPPPPVPNQPPVVNTSIATQTATVGNAYSFAIPAGTFSDPESQTLAYSALGLPAGLTLVGTTISGTPTAEGFTTVTIISQDPGGLTANTSFGLSVLPQNPQPPTGGGLTLLTPLYNCESGAITFRTSGGDGSPVEYFAIGVTGWTTQANQTVEPGLRADPKVLTLHARQNGVEVATLDFDLKAYCSGPPVNQPPVLVNPISNQSTLVNQSYTFIIPGTTFSDPENGPLTYSISGLPAGLNASGLSITGIPSQTGVSTVTVLAIDNGGLTASTSFALQVNPQPPVGGPLALVAPAYDCSTGAITFQTQGGNGSLIEYMAIGVSGWTTNPHQYVDQGLRTATDAGPLSLMARQSGTVVSYSFDLRAYCGASGRLASGEEASSLRVIVLGNPVVSTQAEIEIHGAAGQLLELRLVDQQGKVVHQQRIGEPGLVERVSVPMGSGQGLLLLQVSTATERQHIKLIKP